MWGIPFSLNLNCLPDWVPAGILIFALLPSMVGISIEVPISLNKEQKELLEKFRDIENEKSNPSIKKFFQKAKSFWKN